MQEQRNLLTKAVECAEKAERILLPYNRGNEAQAQIYATLAVAYATAATSVGLEPLDTMRGV